MAGTPKSYSDRTVEPDESTLPDGAVLVNAWSTVENRPLKFSDLNARIHQVADEGHRHIVVVNVLGQRFICAGMEHKGVKVDIYGTPGNDLGVFMDGPIIEVFGSAEDQAGNTMNSGKIIIHGNAWDVTGLAARDGSIFVKGHGGYRIGIHMKQYEHYRPELVYGGAVKEFFGEEASLWPWAWRSTRMEIPRTCPRTGSSGGALAAVSTGAPSTSGAMYPTTTLV